MSGALAELAALRCIGCGCSDDMPCLGGCAWISHDPPLCSQCAEPVDAGTADSAASSSLPSAGRCPASAVPAPHAPIWIDATSGYCVRCRQGFVATEAA